MTVKGLEKHGYESLAKIIAEKNLEAMHKVYLSTGTIWELYSLDMYIPATDATGIHMVKPNFVGWSGLIPISMLIENMIGITTDGSNNHIVWKTDETTCHGIRNLHFGHVVTSLIRNGDTITIESNAPYDLEVNGVKLKVKAGSNQFQI